MTTLKYYAKKDALGYPTPGTMMSIASTKKIPAGCIEIPAMDAINGKLRNGNQHFYVKHDVKGNILPNSLITALKRPSGLVYEVNPFVTPVNNNAYTFIPNVNLEWPTPAGYTLYEGNWTQYDDGNTTSTVPYAGEFFTDGVADTEFTLSTNGYIYGPNNSMSIYANQQDLYLTPGEPLSNNDTQNFWYKNDVYPTKWKTSILVFCGHYSQRQTPYSYILNIYKDQTTQYIETRVHQYNGGIAGPGSYAGQSQTTSQVWSSVNNGVNWSYLGFGKIQ